MPLLVPIFYRYLKKDVIVIIGIPEARFWNTTREGDMWKRVMMMNKKITLIVSLIILIVGFIIIYPVLFQEGNPLPIAKGIMELNFNGKTIAKVSNKPLRYITKISEGDTPIMKMMDKEGWVFVEQFGSGYLFSKEEQNKTITSVQYTRKYRIWGMPNMN